MNDLFIYDIEIVKAIPPRDGIYEEGIEYCDGWHDHANMGVSVICGFSTLNNRYRVFCQDNFDEFVEVANNPNTIMAGFNSIPFDNAVLRASGIVDIPESKSYDLLREIWIAEGLSPQYEYPSHAGYGLDAVAKANQFQGKTGNGAIAPIDWQRGKIGAVVDYCLQDVTIACNLIRKILNTSGLTMPVTGDSLIVRSPFDAP